MRTMAMIFEEKWRNLRPYVCGFVMDPDTGRVMLIRKKRPDWQAGLLNGVGGKIEEGETPLNAMSREFFEEAGKLIHDRAWNNFCLLACPRHKGLIYFFRATHSLAGCGAMTDEPLVPLVGLGDLTRDDVVPNLRWLIPMAFAEDYADQEPVLFVDRLAAGPTRNEG